MSMMCKFEEGHMAGTQRGTGLGLKYQVEE